MPNMDPMLGVGDEFPPPKGGSGGGGPRGGPPPGGLPSVLGYGQFYGFSPGYSGGFFGGNPYFRRRLDSYAPLMQGQAAQGSAPASMTPGGPSLNDYYAGLDVPSNTWDVRMLGQAGLAGTFSPLGNPAISQAIGQRFAREGGARQQSAQIQAMAGAGGDPSLARWARMQAAFDTQSDTANAQSQAQLAHMMSSQDFMRQMLMNRIQDYQRNQAELQRKGWGLYDKPKTDLWGQIGSGFGGGAGAALMAAFL